MKKLTLMAASLAAAMLLVGCSSVSLDESAKEGTTQTASGSRGAYGNAITPEALAADKSVYFAFDSYTVNQRYYSTIDRHVRAMLANPALQARIEGNTDSRGSREYNLALGQKRSEAVKGLMQIRGISSKRLEAVSFGRERPVAHGENEEAWAQNRRADIISIR